MKDKPKSPDSTSFPVRITKSDHQWLVGMAQEHGVEISVIIRWAVTAFRRYIELHDGKLHLPIDLNVTWKSMTANQEAAAIFEKS